MGVQVIILVEDNVRYYSSFLPVIYTELLHHSQRLITEGVNLSHKIMRMRARPKILLCTNYEEAWEALQRYAEDVLGVISDVEFPRAGEHGPRAGAEFARKVRAAYPDVPILLQSSRPENETVAHERRAPISCSRARRSCSRTCATFMLENFGFGDFVFRRPDGTEVDRAADLRGARGEAARPCRRSRSRYHAERNDFSRWLKARTEFELAEGAAAAHGSTTTRASRTLRENLIEAIAAYRPRAGPLARQRLRPRRLRPARRLRTASAAARSAARRAAWRSCASCSREQRPARPLPGRRRSPCRLRRCSAPTSSITSSTRTTCATSRSTSDDDAEIERRFLAAPLPRRRRARDLAAFLERVPYPLAVRSSSLLEDSQYQPFAGVYETYMLPNNAPSLRRRGSRSWSARSSASTPRPSASTRKDYLQATPYRLEEEKMAVIIQRIVGSRARRPLLSGLRRASPARTTSTRAAARAPRTASRRSRSGWAGRWSTAGSCLRFSPRYPRHLLQFSSAEDMLRTRSASSSRSTCCEDLAGADGEHARERASTSRAAEADGTLARDRLDLLARQRRGLRRDRRARASGWSPSRRSSSSGVFPLRRGLRRG